jgi:uncharacterized DUF497 family protein
MVVVDFEWDDEKAEINFKKHEVRFSEAVTIWSDDSALEMHDPDHSDDEDRWIRLGYSTSTRILVVVFCERIEGKLTRIISARKATKEEDKDYHSR